MRAFHTEQLTILNAMARVQEETHERFLALHLGDVPDFARADRVNRLRRLNRVTGSFDRVDATVHSLDDGITGC